MTATVTKVPTAARVEAIELRTGDLALAVLELANIVERLVVGDRKRWKGEESQKMLAAVDNARALASPEDDDDPEPEPASAFLAPAKRAEIADAHAAADMTSRYWIDLRGGGGYGTDNISHVYESVDARTAKNILDRKTGKFLVFNFMLDHGPHNPMSLLYAEAA